MTGLINGCTFNTFMFNGPLALVLVQHRFTDGLTDHSSQGALVAHTSHAALM